MLSKEKEEEVVILVVSHLGHNLFNIGGETKVFNLLVFFNALYICYIH